MDWAKQANDMIKMWTGTQQKVWDSWMASMQYMAAPQNPEAWQKTVDSWRGTVKQALEAQVELTRLWAEAVAANSVNMPTMPTVPGMPAMPGINPVSPTAVVEWSRQVLEMTRNFNDSQTRFVEGWFDMLKKSDPTNVMRGWDSTQVQKVMQSWQEAMQRVIEAQAELGKVMMGIVNGALDKK
ncbi:hypothetical protein [Chloroflexus sp.]|uniref:hypothetical protein n=1 Tax=Chloroflexus sp. TaxID=1904827 RepID=UPI002ACD577D|nr:hypothetical protein [Chloroflexus sp.]